jgi:hypothetical protein
MKRVLTLAFAALLLVGGALALTPREKSSQDKQSAETALTEVKVCPMNGAPIKSENAPSEVVGNYKVYFCCAHHKEAFAKLSQEEKEQKIAAALEKQNKKS